MPKEAIEALIMGGLLIAFAFAFWLALVWDN